MKQIFTLLLILVLKFSAVSVPISESIHRRFDTGSSRKLSFYENRGGGRVKTERYVLPLSSFTPTSLQSSVEIWSPPRCSLMEIMFANWRLGGWCMLPVSDRKGVLEKGFLSMTACELILGYKKLGGFKRMNLSFGQEEEIFEELLRNDPY